MAVDILRWIDFWVGLPLCLLCVPFAFLLRCVQKGKVAPETVRKVVVIKLSELGAIVLAYPCLTALKRQYPNADIHVVTFCRNKEIFALMDDVVSSHHIMGVDDKSWISMLGGLIRLFPWLWGARFDVAVDLEFFSRIGALLSLASLAPQRTGFYRYGFEGLYRGNFLTHRVMYNPLAHVSVNYAALVEALLQPSKESPEVLHALSEQHFVFPVYRHRRELKGLLSKFNLPQHKKIFLMNAGEGVLSLREWPIENFAEVARHIVQDKSCALVLVGTQSAHVKASRLQTLLKDPSVIDLSGKTTLLELMELFLMSRALIANDCGLVHLAMMTPLHKFIFFGPESPQVFGPLGLNTHIFYSRWPCSPCLSILNHRHSNCRDNRCLKAIRPSEVIAQLSHV